MVLAQQETTAPRPPAYRFLIEAILFLAYAAFGVSWIAVTPLLGDLQREFDASSAAMGMLNTAVSVAKVIAPLLTGALAVRLGLRRTILLGAALIALAALAAPLAPSLNAFLAARFVFGLGGAVVVTLLGPAVMQWFARGELPIVNALNNVAVNTGISITLFTTVPLAARLGWRRALLAYAAVNVLLCLAWAVLGRERGDHGASAKNEARAAASAPGPAPARYADVWRLRETWIIALAFTAPLALYLAFNTWLPRYYMEVFQLDKKAASQFAGLINMIGIPAAIAGGVLTKRLGLRRPFLLGAGVAIGFAALGTIFLADPSLRLACAVALGVCFFIGGSALFTAAMELPGVTPAHVSLIMGTVFSAAYLVSSMSPIVVGWLRDRTGSCVPGLALWAVFSWGLGVCGFLLPETGPGAKRRV